MATSQKLDLYKKHKAEYITPKTPKLVEVEPASYLAIAGRGEPGSDAFAAKVGCLYAMAFTVKMASKAAGRDYVVCKLEGLWWGEGEEDDILLLPQDQWNWKLLIRAPEFITSRDLEDAVETLKKKGKASDVAEVQLETIREGRCVQMLHVGPYSKESETIAAMTAFAGENGLSLHGLHHEIYLSDPRRVPEERLRTILRCPVR